MYAAHDLNRPTFAHAIVTPAELLASPPGTSTPGLAIRTSDGAPGCFSTNAILPP
jgi:hypothetical protein